MDNKIMLNQEELKQVNGGTARYNNNGPVYYIVANDCVDCGYCARECSVGAIKECGNVYAIDNAICVNCGTCLYSCPADAIIYG